MLLKSIQVLLLLVTVNEVNAQITDGTVDPDKKRNQTKNEKDLAFENDSLTGTNFYIAGLYQYSYRNFDDMSGFNYYQDWEDQTSSYNGGFSTGLLMDLTEHIQLDIGFSYFGNGENHTWKDSLTDSSYTYENTYMQAALPIRVRYHYGDKWQVFGFAGIAPLNILNIRYESSYTTEAGALIEREPEIRKDGFTAFNLMLSTGIGLCYNIRYVGIMIYPEYRRHLLNTYAIKTISVDHRMYGFGINAGLLMRF